jgi:hypothetical protein
MKRQPLLAKVEFRFDFRDVERFDVGGRCPALDASTHSRFNSSVVNDFSWRSSLRSGSHAATPLPLFSHPQQGSCIQIFHRCEGIEATHLIGTHQIRWFVCHGIATKWTVGARVRALARGSWSNRKINLRLVKILLPCSPPRDSGRQRTASDLGDYWFYITINRPKRPVGRD